MSGRHQQTRFQEALEALELFLSSSGGWMPKWLRAGVPNPPWRGGRLYWDQCGRLGSTRRLVDLVRHHDEQFSSEIELGVPRRSREIFDVHDVPILWCRIEGKDQERRARALRPFPSLVLQEGSSSRRLLIWALARAVSYADCEKLNRRIAYRVGAVQKHAAPEHLRIPAPGTCLRVGRARPVPIVVGRLTTDTYTGEQVAGRLKDPPDVKWWDRASNG